MAAAPDDDARRTLAELEAKLRELERELLRGYEPEGAEADPFAAPEEPAPGYPPPAAWPDEVEPAAAAEPPIAFPPSESEPEAEAAAPSIAFPPAPEPEPAAPPAAFDAAEWTTPDTREHAQPEPSGEPAPSFEAELESARDPQAADEPEPTYDGGLAREPLPAFEPVAADEAEPLPLDVPAPLDEVEPLTPDVPAPLAEVEPLTPDVPAPLDEVEPLTPDVPAAAVASPYEAAQPAQEPAPEPEPEPEPVARLDHDALDAAHGLLATLRDTIEDMGLTAALCHGRGTGGGRRPRPHARPHGPHGTGRRPAEEAAHEAGRLAATVVVEAGPFADAQAVTALRDTLAAQPGARDAYVRGVEGGRAVIEVQLTPPPA